MDNEERLTIIIAVADVYLKPETSGNISKAAYDAAFSTIRSQALHIFNDLEGKKPPEIQGNTPEEDALIIARAKADPDAQPLTEEQLAGMVPSNPRGKKWWRK